MVIFTPEDELMFRQRVNLCPNTFSEGEADPGPESGLQSKIRDWAEKENYPCQINPQTKKLSWFLTPGDPDVVLFLPYGQVALFETKSKTGRLSKVQKDRAITYHYLGHPIHKPKSFKRFLEIVYKLMRRE